MNSSGLLNASLVIGALSGLPLLFRALCIITASRVSMIMLCGAALAAFAGAAGILGGFSAPDVYILSLQIPFGPFEFGADRLSSWFIIPISVVCACSSLYGWRYRNAAEHPAAARRLGVFLGLLYSSMLMTVMARNTILLVLAYELMAVSAYFSMTTDDADDSVRDAGTLYLITAHIAVLAQFALFSLLAAGTGSFLMPAPGTLAPAGGAATVLLILALIGFGGKAGIMPLHVWLPSAHAAAPSHVSAIMSGVLLKLGVYGLVRTLSFFSQPPLWWGVLFLLIGAVSGVAGVVFALGQHDMKRLLAYHSIENIGIIMMGIGVYCIGAATVSMPLMVLGLAGALLHVLNHALFKGLLFLSAGAAIHAAGTREIDRMGGLARRMPATSFMFGLGAVAICGLPPLNGFVSELFIYLGLFRGLQSATGIIPPAMAIAAPLLALIGGLAVACFVKVYGVVFLGYPRSAEEHAAQEAPAAMRFAMVPLACACVVIGVAPALVSIPLQAALSAVIPGAAAAPGLADLAPLTWVSGAALLLAVCVGLPFLWYRRRLAAAPLGSAPTWGCGYLAPAPRMQYTASSFAATLTDLFAPLLRPRRVLPRISGLFPRRSSFREHVPETVLEDLYLPLLERIYRRVAPLRKLQSGLLQHYMLYIFITLLVLLAWGRL